VRASTCSLRHSPTWRPGTGRRSARNCFSTGDSTVRLTLSARAAQPARLAGDSRAKRPVVYELIAAALGSLCEQFVFVGGCAVGLLITDSAAAPVPVTYDVDLVARVSALSVYHGIEKELARLGFRRDTAGDAPLCRWRYHDLEVDLMPMDSRVLGLLKRKSFRRELERELRVWDRP
jgi:hypothetical protein